MHKRLITALMALGVLFSFAACDLFNGLVNKQTEATTTTTEVETTTTAEETTTTEETTTEETTEETSEETSEETTSEETTTDAPTPTKAPTKKPTKVPVKPTYIPKGWHKETDAWGKKYNGHRVYAIYNSSNTDSYKGWWKGKWIKLYSKSKTLHDYEDDDHQYCEVQITLYRDKNKKYKYYTFITD